MKHKLFIFFTIFSLTTFAQTQKNIKINKKYIHLPIQNSVARQKVTFKIDNKKLTQNDIRLAKDVVNYWVSIDVSKYKGKEFSFNFSKEVKGIDKIYQSDTYVNEEQLYKEEFRPEIHFTPRRGWTNDPNGMVFYDGEYHLFYQHNPYETNWGNMTWGHTVSRDLLHWKELPITLLPDELGTMFSGSAVIDYNNTSGFGKKDNPAMVAIYTADNRTIKSDIKEQQCIAYSLDKGRTFTKYNGNPVIPTLKRFGSRHERDPKVFWYEPEKHWVMIQHEGISNCIYNSKDLKSWKHTSNMDAGYWECPELFELSIDGDLNNKKWVVYGVQGIYQIGSFDGRVFTPETEMLRYNIPDGMTAAQTFNDAPKNRRIQIGWGHANFPKMPFKQTFTFPMELRLKTTNIGVRLHVEPIDELKKLHKKSYSFKNVLIDKELNKKLSLINSPLLHIKTTIEIDNSRYFGLDINGYQLKYDIAKNTLNNVFIPLKNRQLKLEILVDKNIIEVYVNDGRYYWFKDHKKINLKKLKLAFLKGGTDLNENPKTWVKSLEISELKSIWK